MHQPLRKQRATVWGVEIAAPEGESLRPFLVCIHDATPAFARETALMLRDLAPLIGRCLSFGVVPNWHNQWPVPAHADYNTLVHENSDELLLHGYCHLRQRGAGAVSWLAECSDEMNGLSGEETRHFVAMGQHAFINSFGQVARGFLAPAWQQGKVRNMLAPALQQDHALSMRECHVTLEYVLGFSSLESHIGKRIPLATFTWDCGRWSALGHVGHGIGWLQHRNPRSVPVLAIHPRDLQRGYWPRILRLTRKLLALGHEPSTPSRLLQIGNQSTPVREPTRSGPITRAALNVEVTV